MISQQDFQSNAAFPKAKPGLWGRMNWSFWLPLVTIAAVVLLNSARMEYATGFDGELYGEQHGSSVIRRLSYLAIGLVGLWLFIKSSSGPFGSGAAVGLMLSLAAYVLLSTLWSEDPSTTFKRAVLFTCLLTAAVGIGKAWSLEHYALAICIASTVFLVLGIAAELRFGSFLTGGTAYRFSGVFHPGKQAFNCGLLMLAATALYLERRSKLFLFLAVVAVALLLLTKARTGAAGAFAAGIFLVAPRQKWGVLIAAAIAAIWFAGAALVYLGAEGQGVDLRELATMGRGSDTADPTKLTGRLPVWEKALEEYSTRPFLGFGYGAFWSERRLSEFERRAGWAPAHAHSGYIESLLNMGLLGCVLFVLAASLAFFKSLRLSSDSSLAQLVASVIVMAAVASLTERAFMSEGYEFICLASGIAVISFESGRLPIGRQASLGRHVKFLVPSSPTTQSREVLA